MKRILILTIFVLSLGQVKSQIIEIGLDADQIKTLAEWTAKDQNRPDSYGNTSNSRASYDVSYNNGHIADVALCYDNSYFIDMNMMVNYCKHYVMENDKLAYILTQYENVSFEKLQTFYNKSYKDRIFDDYYFEDDYKHYYKIYLATNGYATAEWRKTDYSILPSSIKYTIQEKLKKEEDYENQKEVARQKEKEHKKEITSKIYDLKTKDSYKYSLTLDEIERSFIIYFRDNTEPSYGQSDFVPRFSEFADLGIKQYRISNIYSAYYKLKDNSREGVDYGSYYEAGNRDINQTENITLVSGNDPDCKFFKYVTSIKLPTLKIDDYEVMTEATFPNIKVDAEKGITVVKIKNNGVTFMRNKPDSLFQPQIIEKLKSEQNGRYLVKYIAAKIDSKSLTTAELEKAPNRAWKVISSIGGGILVVAGIIFLL